MISLNMTSDIQSLILKLNLNRTFNSKYEKILFGILFQFKNSGSSNIHKPLCYKRNNNQKSIIVIFICNICLKTDLQSLSFGSTAHRRPFKHPVHSHLPIFISISLFFPVLKDIGLCLQHKGPAAVTKVCQNTRRSFLYGVYRSRLYSVRGMESDCRIKCEEI